MEWEGEKEMKRLLLILALLVMVVGVQGLALDFQNQGDWITHISSSAYYGTWFSQNATGGNSYLLGGSPNGVVDFQNADPIPMTYAAATTHGGFWPMDCYRAVDFVDSAGTTMQHLGTGSCDNTWTRTEIIISGGTPNIYTDGILTSTGAALAQNPSYIRWTTNNIVQKWDDVIYGSSQPLLDTAPD